MTSMIIRLNLDLEFKVINEKSLGNKEYKAIRYEELIISPHKVLKEILNFIPLKYDKQVLSPTVLGCHSFGNSYINKISKIS